MIILFQYKPSQYFRYITGQTELLLRRRMKIIAAGITQKGSPVTVVRQESELAGNIHPSPSAVSAGGPGSVRNGAEAFSVFLSYSNTDRRDAETLQRALERFRIPKALVGTSGRCGPVPRRLRRVFMDRTDLSAAQDITQEIEAALTRSECLVVLCSKSAASSDRWVQREILASRRVRPAGRIFAIIVRDAPPDCFPQALFIAAGDVASVPLAADIRPEGDGYRDALIKLVAGIIGVDFDVLRRQRAREERRRRAMFAALTIGYATTITAALVGVTRAAVELLTSRNAAIADRAKAANDTGRTDLAMLFAATSLPPRPSWLEHSLPAAEAQAVRALLSNRVEAMYPSGGATLSAWSPSRRRLYLARYGANVTALDVESGQAVQTWQPGIGDVTELAISPDERFVAMARENGAIAVVDAVSGSVRYESEPGKSPGRALAFSPHGNRVAVGRQDGTAQVWTLGAPGWGPSAPARADWPITGIAFSMDGQRILSSSNVKLIEWDADTGAPLREHQGRGTVFGIDPLYGGLSWGVTYNLAKFISVLPARTHESIRTISLPAEAVRLRSSEDGSLLIASSWESRSAMLMESVSGQVEADLPHPEWVDDAAILPLDGRVLTLSRDGYVRIWRNPLARAGRRLQALQRSGRSVVALGQSDQIYVGGSGPAVVEVDHVTRSVRPVVAFSCENAEQAQNQCWMVGLHVLEPAGDLIYVIGDGRIGRLEPRTGRTKWESRASARIVASGLRSRDGRLMLALANGQTQEAETEQGKLSQAVGAIFPGGDLSHGAVEFDPTGDLVAHTDAQGILVRNASSGAVAWRAPVYDRIPISVAWMHKERQIAMGTAGMTVQLFPEGGGGALRILSGHTSWVRSLSAQPGGRYLASVSDQELIVWDTLAGEAVLTIPYARAGGFSEVSFSHDGNWLVMTDSAGGAQIVPFDVPEDHLREALCAQIPGPGRTFSDAQMREFNFLWSSDRSPCTRPPMFSIDQLGRLAGWSSP